MTEGQPDSINRFVSFDAAGEVFLSQERILRGIYPGNGDLYRKILRLCEAHDLFQSGVVPTRELPVNPHPELPYEMVLEHERIPFVSYPHEWSAQMLKDAALFHIDLYQTLNRHGLTIKDFHPYNILFKNTRPVFVDFTSIIFSDSLSKEEYLKPTSRGLRSWLCRLMWDIDAVYFYEMYQRMFVPYFLLPLYLMQQGRHSYARTRLLESALNAATKSPITPQEQFRYAAIRPWRWQADIARYVMKSLSKQLALLQRGKTKSKFLEILGREVSDLPASLTASAYSQYYEGKDENFGFEPSLEWTDKHRAVYESIRRLQPKTVLDVGCNVGWFSILASKMGCRVVAFDVDEACIDVLYMRAKQEHLDILPLVLDSNKPTADVYPHASENKKHILTGGKVPLLLAADKRLKCDIVIALALVHHLVLGQGQTFTQAIQSLNSFTNRHLILEFVPRNDERIVAEPGFFPALSANPAKFEWYTQENLINELKRHFQRIDVTRSFPAPRTILICSK